MIKNFTYIAIKLIYNAWRDLAGNNNPIKKLTLIKKYIFFNL